MRKWNFAEPSENLEVSPSHWPLFRFLWKPALHWQMLLTFVWLQTASSPHGLLFFPHTSPLDTRKTNKRAGVLFASGRPAEFFLWCAKKTRKEPLSSIEGTLPSTHIHYHKYHNIPGKWAVRDSSALTLGTFFISPQWRFDVCSSQLTPHLRALQSCSSEPSSPQSLKRSHCSCIGMQRWLLQVNSVFPQGRDLRATVSACVHTSWKTHTHTQRNFEIIISV